jgi:hypothetical protein
MRIADMNWMQVVDHAGDRSRGFTCKLDGEHPLDAAAGRGISTGAKPPVEIPEVARANAAQVRESIGGSYHGLCQRSDSNMLALWEVAIEETRSAIEQDWP